MLNVRRASLETVVRILEDGAYANLALKDAAKTVDAHDVPFLYALVNETIARASYLDFILSHWCRRQKRTVRNLLRMAGTELLYLNTPAHAVVNESVALCRDVGKAQSTGLVNAILRRLDRERDALPSLPDDPVERLSIFSGVPKPFVAEWIDAYGEAETEALLNRAPMGTEVRAQYPFTTDELIDALPVPAERTALDPNGVRLLESFDLEHSDLFRDGKLAVQNEGAMLICRALGDVHDQTILDACAAPGGKTAYLASLSENTAKLVAWELHPHRKALLDATLNRLHVAAETACIDATVLQPDCVGAFDAVLIDVPCSGLGLLSDKPDVRLKKSEETIRELIAVQDRLLNVCSQYVKNGGVLVYATCTISKRENTDRVVSFLRRNRTFAMEIERQLLPTRDGTNGFYYAVMRKE